MAGVTRPSIRARAGGVPRVLGPDASETVLRLAVLMEAGVAPDRAWAYLGDLGDSRAASVAERVASGETVPEALRADGFAEPTWGEVAAAWSLATTVGAPLAPTLRAFAATLRDAAEVGDEIRIALAEPTSTARLMGWLPAVGVVLAVVLGFDPLGVLLREPIGWACSIAGAGLLVGARRWTKRLAARAQSDTRMPGLDADLVAIALSGGVSIPRALHLVDAVTDGRLSAHPPPVVEQTLALSSSAGVPAVDLLRAGAALERHRARVEGRLRAARLSARLLLPLGVCTLPAFLCLGVAPMFLSILPAVGFPSLPAP